MFDDKTNEELLKLFYEAVENNTNFNWVKGEKSRVYSAEISQLSQEILKRMGSKEEP